MKRLRIAGAVAAFGLLLVLSREALPQTVAGAAPVADFSGVILPDPNIRIGVLPNGLRYAVMHNATPKGAIAIRLGIDAGEFEEGPGERGTAHFLEHMAFSGGQNEHEAGPEKAFAEAGVTFGRDQNAETGTFSTVFRLDMPKGDAASLDLAFNWLRKVADGAAFPEAAIDRERGIILAERETRRTPMQQASEAADHFFTPNLKSAGTDSIGTVAELQTMTGAKVQTFYQRWYRPDNAVLVIVGDDTADALEARVKQTFSSWTGTGPVPARPAFGMPIESRGVETLIRSDPRLPPSLAICRVHKPMPHSADNVARLRAETLSSLWTRVLNRRLARLTATDHPPFMAASAQTSDENREAGETCVYVALLKGSWETGLRAAGQEIRRFAETGPTQTELDDAIDAARATYRGAMRSETTRSSAALANTILTRQLVGDVMASPPEMFRAFDVAVENATPQDVRTAFAGDWSGSGPLLVLFDTNPPKPETIRAGWNRIQTEPLPPQPPAPKISPWSYDDFGTAGHVVKREEMTSPDFVRLTFDNGVILNFKRTNFQQEMVQVRVSFGVGRREIVSRDFSAAKLGADLSEQGGTGRHDFQEIEQIFSQVSFDASLFIGNDGFVMKGATMVGSLKPQLQLLAAYASDPGFRPTLDTSLPTLIDYYYRQNRANAGYVIDTAMGDALMPGGPMSLPPEGKLARLHMSDFARLLKPALTQAPLEITIVGDVDEAVATGYVAGTFGALPARQGKSRERSDTEYLRFPTGDLPTIHATHEGPDGEAFVGAIWPLYVASPERRREEVALTVLTAVFNNELRHRIRQELGKAYSPNVEMSTPDNADQGFLEAVAETSRDDANNVAAEIRALASRLAKGDISDDAIDAARAPLLATMSERTATNNYWADYLEGSAALPAKLVEMVQVPQLVAAVTPAEVRKAAADWLTRSPMVVIATPAGSTGDR